MNRNSILTPMKLSSTSEIPKNNNENKKINNMKDFNKKDEKYLKS